jgi:hypothetical protein
MSKKSIRLKFKIDLQLWKTLLLLLLVVVVVWTAVEDFDVIDPLLIRYTECVSYRTKMGIQWDIAYVICRF